ncbi:MAG TPA: EAL domain-containing protein [Gemmatimonadaceae bacterium]|nr:EAL domain-containing protein [Gemmatimonadaceae bacterium]
MRARFAIAFGLLLSLATLNIAAFNWGARKREREFQALHHAIAVHSALNETRADLDNQYKRVKIVSDLLGVEQVSLGRAEYDRIVQSIRALRAKLAPLSQHPAADAKSEDHQSLVLTSRRIARLADSWIRFYTRQLDDPGAALAEVVVTAEPLAQELLTKELPRAIEAENVRVQQARDTFVATDRLSSRLVWIILLATGLLSAALAYSLSRHLLRAIVALKAGAERFGTGDFNYRVTVPNAEELAEVGNSLNTMALRLRYAREELEVRNVELANLAFKDVLTQLANRAVFRERVELALAAQGRRPEEIAVLFVDVDNFKAINDTLGHGVGDRLLVDVAKRLLSATRGIDTVARLGGDEFAILLDHMHVGKQAIVVAERIITNLAAPFSVDGHVVHISASLGLAWGRDGEGADELLRNADVAMYRAKARGKGRYEIFAPDMHRALLDRAQLETELRAAIEREELCIAYQPLVKLDTEEIVGFEALARWNHPTRGPISPEVFIPLAEDTGTILPLGRKILQDACSEVGAWCRSLGIDEPLSISVNVPSRQLEHPSFVNDVIEALERAALPPHCLILEITETAVMRESAVTLLRLNHLKALGVRLAIDDFGTGYSSLAYLRRFPVDVIKIDKAFVDGIVKGASDTALVQAIITLSQALQLSTVAEGIELAKQAAVLRELGCELGQGFLFSRPLSAADAQRLLREAGIATLNLRSVA